MKNHTKMFSFIMMGSKPLHIRFIKVNEFVRVHDGTIESDIL